jgi:nitrile hydratase subunit beta
MRRVHDRGGVPEAGPIDRSEHEYSLWEKRTDAMLRCLWERGVLNVDEHRRAIESIEPAAYETLSYYERWLVALESLLVEKGILTRAEIDGKIEERPDATR